MTEPSEMFADGAAYERMMGRWSKLAGGQFLRWIDLPPGKSWLDVGCGNGAFTEEIAAKANASSLTGIDPSDAQVAFARKRPALRSAALHVGDAQALPFQDNAFDVGVMALVIAFVPDPAKGAAELARVVKSGGMAASYMWDLPNLGVPLSPLYRALTKLGHPAPPPPNPHASSIDAMQGMWADAGLTSVETTVFRIDVTFKNLEDFWQTNAVPIGPLGKVIASLSPAETLAMKVELQASLPVQPDGTIVYGATANAVKGVKAK